MRLLVGLVYRVRQNRVANQTAILYQHRLHNGLAKCLAVLPVPLTSNGYAAKGLTHYLDLDQLLWDLIVRENYPANQQRLTIDRPQYLCSESVVQLRLVGNPIQSTAGDAD